MLLKAAVQWWKTWRRLPVMPWLKGAIHYRAKRYDLAASCYQKGLDKYPSHTANLSARLDLSFCLFKLGKLEEAERNLRYVTLHARKSKKAFMRLARIQLWSGRSLEAAWTLRRALQQLPADKELAGLFLYSVVENQGPLFLLQEAKAVAELCKDEDSTYLMYQTAIALYGFYFEEKQSGLRTLKEIVNSESAPLDAIIAYAEILLSKNESNEAKKILQRALKSEPNSPRVLTLLASTYLQAGDLKNADYAVQLALSACQNSAWLSPRELHVLAEAYAEAGDVISALIAANRSKQEGERLLGHYRHSKSLTSLIDSLSQASH